ncbi:iron transporter [Gammaproteobacteria bacterium ESL0073]|uniref:Iron transporter n=1 Tax=Entomomonas moraniae TaxID=2213226 RepID=A0A3S9XBF6_9GAMM|nr:iron transporter [Entomomonas moraniae]AWM80673.1 iron transporter [Gammaproteobacteria bacterium ESL0073]AZS49691.1 iron transporter [Entomomonas moraniae]
MKPLQGQTMLKYRLAVAIRCLIASAGGYTLSVACNLFLAFYLPLPKAEAVIAANLLSIIIFCCVVCWVFSVASNTKAFIITFILSVLLFLLVYIHS